MLVASTNFTLQTVLMFLFSLRFPRKGNIDGVRRGAFDPMDPDVLCGIIFVRSHLTAKILFYLLNVSVNSFL